MVAENMVYMLMVMINFASFIQNFASAQESSDAEGYIEHDCNKLHRLENQHICSNLMLQDKLSVDALSFSLKYNLTASRIYDHNRRTTSAPNIPYYQAEEFQNECCRRSVERISQTQNHDHLTVIDELTEHEEHTKEAPYHFFHANPSGGADLIEAMILGPEPPASLVDVDSPIACFKFLLHHENTIPANESDFLKTRSNLLHFTLNKEHYSTIDPKTAPILLKITEETENLSKFIHSLRFSKRVKETMLIVTIESRQVHHILRMLIHEVDFIFTRIYLHSMSASKNRFKITSTDDSPILRNNLHTLYGLDLALVQLNFTYVVTVESDMIVSEDFVEFHLHLSEYSAYHPHVLAVTAFPEGPHHDCHWIADKLQGGGLCPANDPAVLFANKDFHRLGSGLTRKSLSAILSMKSFGAIEYDAMLRSLISNSTLPYFALSPCKPRIKHLPSFGGKDSPHADSWDAEVSMERGDSVFFVYKVIFPSENDDANVDTQFLVTPQMDLPAQAVRDRLLLSQMPHSAHRCVGVDWMSRSCHFKRLCFNPHAGAEHSAGVFAGGEFVYFADPALGQVHEAAPMEVALNSGVTAGPEGYGPKWAPRVIEERIPGDVALVGGGPFVLLTEYNFANPMLLLADYYLPWFLLLGIFGFEGDAVAASTALRASLRRPLDSSCQFMHRGLCDRMADLFFPGGGPRLLSDQPFFDLDSVGARADEGTLLCFDEVLAGTGRLNDHCSDTYVHGVETSAPLSANTYCNVGRAPQLRRFRSMLLLRLGVAEPPRPRSAAGERRLVVMGRFLVLDNSVAPEELIGLFPAIRAGLLGRGIDSVEGDLPALRLAEQAALVCGASAYLGICGGGASMLGLFMGPGSFLFLSCQARLDSEALLNHGLAQPVYFQHAGVREIVSTISNVFQALGHF